MNGWIKLHRKIKDHWLWQDAEKLKWWVSILMEVNHEGRKVLIKGKLFDCERGQSLKSLDTWAKEWRTTKKTVRSFFILLQQDGMLTISSVTVSTRITVCNYESYQDNGNEEETQSKRKVNARETQATPKQEGKELKNEKKKKEYAPAVLLFEEEFTKLNAAYGSYAAMQMIGKLSAYKQSEGKKYKSDYAAINNWVVEWWAKQGGKQTPNNIDPQTGRKQVVI